MKPLLGRPTIHQTVEYSVGFALASSAVRSQDRVLLVIAAVAVIINTAVLAGPLAAYPKVPRGVHRAVDVLLATVGVSVAIVVSVSVQTRVSLCIAAAVVTFVSVRFSHVIRETGS